MSNFMQIGALSDIPPQGARVIKTQIGCVAIFRTDDDKVFALDDRCPHKNGPISNGIQHGEFVTCPLHNWVFDLNTGEAQGADEGLIKTYPVQVKGDQIFLDVSQLNETIAAE